MAFWKLYMDGVADEQEAFLEASDRAEAIRAGKPRRSFAPQVPVARANRDRRAGGRGV